MGILDSIKTKIFHGNEDNYTFKKQRLLNSVTLLDMIDIFGEDWLDKGEFISANLLSIGGHTDGFDVKFWFLDEEGKLFEDIMDEFYKGKRNDVRVYAILNTVSSRFRVETIRLQSLYSYSEVKSLRRNLKEQVSLISEYKKQAKLIDDGKVDVTPSQLKKIESEMKKYKKYLNGDYVYSDPWLPEMYEDRGFPKIKYACLDPENFLKLKEHEGNKKIEAIEYNKSKEIEKIRENKVEKLSPPNNTENKLTSEIKVKNHSNVPIEKPDKIVKKVNPREDYQKDTSKVDVDKVDKDKNYQLPPKKSSIKPLQTDKETVSMSKLDEILNRKR